jgi:isopenicillin-N N-acyltransferase-like protein
MSSSMISQTIRSFCVWASIAFIVAVCGHAVAAEPSVFDAAKHKSGELQFIEGLPVVTVEGTPEEIGEQLGTLFKKPLASLPAKQEAFAKGFGFKQPPAVLMKTGNFLLPWFPENHRRELQAVAKAAEMDENFLIFGNLMYELSRFPACSTLTVEPDRSKTDGPLFGRNLDFPTFGFLDKYSVVVIYRPTGKHAFASMSFPGFFGVASGINDAGLCVAQLEVGGSAEKKPGFNPRGTPVALCFRRILEECTTVDEAEKLLREQSRLTMCNLAVCDRKEAAVLELTPNTVVRRPADRGLCACTNHFRTKGLALVNNCPRYAELEKAQQHGKLSLDDLAKHLNSVNQGRNTIQTMIFEPATLKAHLSFGPLPSSAQPLKLIDLTSLLLGNNKTAQLDRPSK